jgi:hypothetical protein
VADPAGKIPLATHTDNTRMYQLLNLDADVWVLEMLLQRRWVFLGLLENAVHDGIL